MVHKAHQSSSSKLPSPAFGTGMMINACSIWNYAIQPEDQWSCSSSESINQRTNDPVVHLSLLTLSNQENRTLRQIVQLWMHLRFKVPEAFTWYLVPNKQFLRKTRFKFENGVMFGKGQIMILISDIHVALLNHLVSMHLPTKLDLGVKYLKVKLWS